MVEPGRPASTSRSTRSPTRRGWRSTTPSTKGRGGRGCVITWAAGNGNESVDNDGYASYERVIAVAACNDTGTRSAYSDMGKALWCAFPSQPRRAQSLTPGIWTTDRTGAEGYNPGDESLGDDAGDYTNSFGGTSSACPGVAGVAALILAVNPELRWREVRDLLRACCDRIDEAGGDYDADGHSRAVRLRPRERRAGGRARGRRRAARGCSGLRRGRGLPGRPRRSSG